MSKTENKKGFTLLEVLLVVALLAIIFTIVSILINPLEIIKRSRDASRITDFENLEKVINTAVQDLEHPEDAPIFLCNNSNPPCSGNSTDSNASKNNGTGWIKADLGTISSINVSSLPMDPINNGQYYYTYQSDNGRFEINTVFESLDYKIRMQNDKGNNPNKYEMGSDLNLIN